MVERKMASGSERRKESLVGPCLSVSYARARSAPSSDKGGRASVEREKAVIARTLHLERGSAARALCAWKTNGASDLTLRDSENKLVERRRLGERERRRGQIAASLVDRKRRGGWQTCWISISPSAPLARGLSEDDISQADEAGPGGTC